MNKNNSSSFDNDPILDNFTITNYADAVRNDSSLSNNEGAAVGLGSDSSLSNNASEAVDLGSDSSLSNNEGAADDLGSDSSLSNNEGAADGLGSSHILRIEHLNKSFGDLKLFEDFSMNFEEGKITAILGASGCGKTTLLNILCGITTPDSGTLIGFEGSRFSYIFQEPRLLPWKTVRGNIEFVVDRAFSPQLRHKKVEELMDRVELSQFANYYPSQLSGGMRQRVSIARSFAVSSDIILMDEPLNGLDAALKRTMISWFKQIWNSDPRTVIYVTHDEDEAKQLGSRITTIGQNHNLTI